MAGQIEPPTFPPFSSNPLIIWETRVRSVFFRFPLFILGPFWLLWESNAKIYECDKCASLTFRKALSATGKLDISKTHVQQSTKLFLRCKNDFVSHRQILYQKSYAGVIFRPLPSLSLLSPPLKMRLKASLLFLAMVAQHRLALSTPRPGVVTSGPTMGPNFSRMTGKREVFFEKASLLCNCINWFFQQQWRNAQTAIHIHLMGGNTAASRQSRSMIHLQASLWIAMEGGWGLVPALSAAWTACTLLALTK